LIYQGRNILRLPLETRRELLTEALSKVEYPVLRSQNFDAKPADLIRAAKELELEGIIAKRKDSVYEPGRRSGAWLKYKINRSQEFVIGGYTAGNPFDALIVGLYATDSARILTRRITSDPEPFRFFRDLTGRERDFSGKRILFSNLL
jgi:bifunctional non-homologous end joining protein LigD